VKASGGVRTREDAEKMRSAGASRIGASASVAIVTGQSKPDGGGDKKKPGAY
jgi:deoxyribose-phosphate aldolase